MENVDLIFIKINGKDHPAKLGYFALKKMKSLYGFSLKDTEQFDDIETIGKILYCSLIKPEIDFEQFEIELDKNYNFQGLTDLLDKLLSGIEVEEENKKKIALAQQMITKEFMTKKSIG